MSSDRTKITFKWLDNSKDTEDQFENMIERANDLWVVGFGKTATLRDILGDNYYMGCDCDACNGYDKSIVIGSINDDTSSFNGTDVCCATIEIDENNVAYVSKFCANPTQYGYGTLLMAYIINHLQKRDIEIINLNVDVNANTYRITKFYQKFKFFETSSYYDKIWMQKKIKIIFVFLDDKKKMFFLTIRWKRISD
jgi:hypothetical protein